MQLYAKLKELLEGVSRNVVTQETLVSGQEFGITLDFYDSLEFASVTQQLQTMLSDLFTKSDVYRINSNASVGSCVHYEYGRGKVLLYLHRGQLDGTHRVSLYCR